MNKKKLLFFSGFIIIILVFILIVYKNSYKNEIYTEKNDENVKNNEKINKIPGMVSLMLETKAGSGVYEPSTSTTWPTKGYELNTEKSGCENGGTLSYNETTKKVIVKTNISDKCYAYFDVIPPDVTLSITNRPTTYGKLGSINCTGSSATYNQQYNRVEISQINGGYTSCTLNYTDSTSKVNLATYITGFIVSKYISFKTSLSSSVISIVLTGFPFSKCSFTLCRNSLSIFAFLSPLFNNLETLSIFLFTDSISAKISSKLIVSISEIGSTFPFT